MLFIRQCYFVCVKGHRGCTAPKICASCPLALSCNPRSALGQYIIQSTQSHVAVPKLLVAFHNCCMNHWHFPLRVLNFLAVTMRNCPKLFQKVHHLVQIYAIHLTNHHQICESLSISMSSNTLLRIKRIRCACLQSHISTNL